MSIKIGAAGRESAFVARAISSPTFSAGDALGSRMASRRLYFRYVFLGALTQN
jgi:hypothetical protein